MRLAAIIVTLLLSITAVATDAQERQMPSVSEIQAAIKMGRLINGMTFKQATAAMRPAKADVTKQGARIVAAVWVVPDPDSDYATQWSADIDPDMTIWNVQRNIVRQRQTDNAREQRIINARERQRG